jgi:hypothetical protein
MKQSITCMCEKKFEADFPEIVDLAKTPGVLREIIEGTFMTIACPACHKLLKPEIPFRIFDAKAEWEIQFVPELVRQENMKNPPSLSGKKTMRLVIGYTELCEKLKLFSEKLDDRTVEYLKYVILSKVLEKTASEEKDISVSYTERQGDELLFHIHGLKEGEVGIFRIKSAVYKKTLDEIDTRASEAPFNEFLVPPYVSVNRLYSWDDYDE